MVLVEGGSGGGRGGGRLGERAVAAIVFRASIFVVRQLVATTPVAEKNLYFIYNAIRLPILFFLVDQFPKMTFDKNLILTET